MMGCPPQGSSQHITHTESDPRSSASEAQALTSTSGGPHSLSGQPYRSQPQQDLLGTSSPSPYNIPYLHSQHRTEESSQQQGHFPATGQTAHQHSLSGHFLPTEQSIHQQSSLGHRQFQQQQYGQHSALDCPTQQQSAHPLASGQPFESQYQLTDKESAEPQAEYQRQTSCSTLTKTQSVAAETRGVHSQSASVPTQVVGLQTQSVPTQTSGLETQSVLTEASGLETQSVLMQAAGLQSQNLLTQAAGLGSHGLSMQEGSVQVQGGLKLQAIDTSTYLQYRLPPTEHSPPDMLDKKPTLQVMTSEHSPGSPGSTTSSPCFIFPDMARSSSSGHLASDSGSSPFMSPVKREVKWEVGTPPQSSDLDLSGTFPAQQTYRTRVLSGDTEPSETLVDSETGSSILEDSSSSREQSPFSAMAESLSLRSPSEHSPSPLARKVFHRQVVVLASEDEDPQGEEFDRSGMGISAPAYAHSPHGISGETEANPPKLFKKRLHERYVLSLKDCPRPKEKLKEEFGERFTAIVSDFVEREAVYLDPKRPLTKLERPDSPINSESSLPKSPRRSSSDTDNVRTDLHEMGASSADEGDVFMEPKRVRTKTRPPSLHHQREPLDLSRGTVYSGSGGFRSSPLIDPEHLSPATAATKHFSPPSVFRSPHHHHHHHHRLPPHHQFSPHQGLLSPQQQQSQSPLCSVPEGGRIFSFNVPSPLEGAHSDSDLISPSPMSPRIFTFPPQGMMNPMSEVNRLAVSPRAPYTPPPPFLHTKALGSPGASGLDAKFGEQHGFYGKRSLSESDMTYLCPVCGQVFPTNDNLAKHMAKHLPTETIRSVDNNKVHYCKVCNRSFSRSDMLTRHMRLHTGLKPYECGDCGQVFSRSDHLNTHRRTHTGEKPYRCPQCPYAACRRDMITRHMRTHVKRTSRRGRYLSVPDDGDGQKSGSVSSTETTDSVGGHTCSVSSVDSVESESPLPSSSSIRHSYMGASVDSLLSPDPEEMLSPPPSDHHTHHHHTHHHRSHTLSSSHRPSQDLDEDDISQTLEGCARYDRFMHYRKARNWSTTSLESVDSEEASLIREVFLDDAFQECELAEGGVKGGGDKGGGCETQGMATLTSHKDAISVSVETQSLQKCFISRESTGSSGGSS